MNNSILKVLYTHANAIRYFGFGLSLISLIVYMTNQQNGLISPQLAFTTCLIGFGIYVIGRIALVFKTREEKQKNEFQPDNKDKM